MKIFLLNFMISLLIPLALITISLLTTMNSSKDREKLSPFECGFDPMKSARIPFSLRFFLLAVIFLVFDIEIVLLLPMPSMMFTGATTAMMTFSTLVFIILMYGLIHEWREGSLDWAI